MLLFLIYKNKLAKLRRHAIQGKLRLEKVWARKSFSLKKNFFSKKLGDGGDFLGG